MNENNLYWQARQRTQNLFGQANVITIPRVFVKWTGDINAAILLNQTLYLSSHRESGWFAKSYEDWNEFCGLSKFQVKRAFDILAGLNIGLETVVKKHNGVPTLHYRIDPVSFWSALDNFLAMTEEHAGKPSSSNLTVESEETSPSMDSEETSPSMDSEETSLSYIDKDKELKPRKNMGTGGAVVEKDKKQGTKRQRNWHFEAVAHYAFGAPWGGPWGKDVAGRTNKILKELRDTFPDDNGNIGITPDDIALAYAWNNEPSPRGRGLSAPGTGATVVRMLHEWRGAGAPDFVHEQRSAFTRSPQEAWAFSSEQEN